MCTYFRKVLMILLQEADNWTTLSADVEDVFQSQDIEAVSLYGFRSSLFFKDLTMEIDGLFLQYNIHCYGSRHLCTV